MQPLALILVREIYFAEEGRQFMGLDITDLEGAPCNN
jgi:hypothetical protein